MGGLRMAAPGAPFPVLMALLHLLFGAPVRDRGFCRYLSPRGPLVHRRTEILGRCTRGTGSQDATGRDPWMTVATRRVANFARTR